MNTNSHYKNKFKKSNNKKQNDKNIKVNEISNIHIKLDTPIVDPNSECFNYQYDLSSSINTDITKINKMLNIQFFNIYFINIHLTM